MEADETVLIKSAQDGDYGSFETLVKRNEKKIYNIAYRIMGSPDDASDVLQETFLQAFRKIKDFHGGSKFSTWLYRIAVNICLMRKRKKSVKNTVSLDMPVLTRKEDELNRQVTDDWSGSPLATLENRELRENLSGAIERLPDEYRTVFLLKGFDDMSNEEIAKVLDISVPAVKSRLHRARMFLRDRLTEYFKGTERA